MSGNDDQVVISIRPEPSTDELAALVAAVTAALGVITAAELSQPKPSRWSRQGRLDAMGGLDGLTDDR